MRAGRAGAHGAGRPAVLKVILPARRGRARAPRAPALARQRRRPAAARRPAPVGAAARAAAPDEDLGDAVGRRGLRGRRRPLPAAARARAAAAAPALVVRRPVDRRAGARCPPTRRSRGDSSSRRSRSAGTSSPTPRTDARLIHGDLHYENVLAADREPWLVIDPKPMAGDPHYELAPMLWNRWDEVVASGDVRDAVRRAVPHARRRRGARRAPGPRLGRGPRDAQRALDDRGAWRGPIARRRDRTT